MASALAQKGASVALVLDGEHVQGHMFPRGLAESITADFAGHGVELLRGLVENGEAGDDGVTLHLQDGTRVTADAAVIGIGVHPRTALAEQAGLTVDDGVVVDERLRTSAADVYAAGDVAAYDDPLLGRRRVEHVDNAEKMGEAAGRVMAGADTTYAYTPYFWSDLFDAGYEAIGDLSADLTLVEDWADDDHGTGVVYYLADGSVRGVLLWNVWGKVDLARDLIAETGRSPVTDPGSLRGRIPLS
jgi:NADPH-dependent 2,4-dienoyl-CoA reductase/sulfur reductase-like enzyme